MALRRKDKYEVDPDLIRSLEEESEDFDEYEEGFEEEYEYDDGPLSPKRVKWAWIILFLALGILIGALVFTFVSRHSGQSKPATTVSTT
ncbi:MAG: hypothetical protein J6Y62_00725, partial [Clostridia bacterium]|nr:hypothetical protein [Clostridia bacterium]